EVLRDRGADVGDAAALQRRAIRGGDDDDAALEPLGPEAVLHELAHLAAALADEHDDVDVAPRPSREHAEQRALAAAGRGEDAEALSLADAEQAVDRAHAGLERTVDQLALERVRRRGVDRGALARLDRAEAVERFAVRVED